MANLPQATTKWDGSVELQFPYDRCLVEHLKLTIPSYARTWDPLLKIWTISAPWAMTAIHLLHAIFPDAAVIDGGHSRPPGPTPIRPLDESYRTLYLQPNAPDYVVEAVYRAIAKEEHPDRKPLAERERAHERLVAVNRAVEVLRAKVAS